MTMSLLSLLFLVLPVVVCSSSYPSCYQESLTWPYSSLLDGLADVPSPYHCQDVCRSNKDCAGFTWYTSDRPLLPNFCDLYVSTVQPTYCYMCVSGME